MKLSRRQLLRGAVAGGVAAGVTTLGFSSMRFTKGGLMVPAGPAATSASALAPAPVGTFELFQQALELRKAISFGGNVAFAQTRPKTLKIIHVKVMNQFHAKLVFRPGTLTAPATGDVTAPTGERTWAQKASASATALVGMGIDKVMTNPRGQALRLNQWWGNMFFSGAENGTTPTQLTGYVGNVTDAVAFQGIIGINENAAHRYSNMCYPAAGQIVQKGVGGDFMHDLLKSGIINPSLGLTCFNMGGLKETPDGGRRCSVLASDRTASVADGKSVDELTDVLNSVISTGLVEDTLVGKFDALGSKESVLRQSMVASRQKLLATKAKLEASSAVGTTQQIVGVGNKQQTGHNPEVDATAQSEFLAQCRWVVDALEIDGQPFSAFCLDLHVADLDGNQFDRGQGPGENLARGLSYVEGMRQLALGLNVLAQAVARYDDVYVLVTSEGGRNDAAGDDTVPSAIILGPSKTKDPVNGLSDRLFVHSDFMSSASVFARDPSGTAMALNTGGLVSFGGTADASALVRNSDVLHGLRVHLEKIVPATVSRTSDYGNRIVVST
ncbi:MAG: hypothetical protein U0169_10115 [Polyangiaceae bacterium]